MTSKKRHREERSDGHSLTRIMDDRKLQQSHRQLCQRKSGVRSCWTFWPVTWLLCDFSLHFEYDRSYWRALNRGMTQYDFVFNKSPGVLRSKDDQQQSNHIVCQSNTFFFFFVRNGSLNDYAQAKDKTKPDAVSSTMNVWSSQSRYFNTQGMSSRCLG